MDRRLAEHHVPSLVDDLKVGSQICCGIGRVLLCRSSLELRTVKFPIHYADRKAEQRFRRNHLQSVIRTVLIDDGTDNRRFHKPDFFGILVVRLLCQPISTGIHRILFSHNESSLQLSERVHVIGIDPFFV